MNHQQIATHNNQSLSTDVKQATDSLSALRDYYLNTKAGNSTTSQKAQRSDINLFLSYLQREHGSDHRQFWTPRLTRRFVDELRSTVKTDGSPQWSNSTINRFLSHLRVWASWIHNSVAPFPLGHPMNNIKQLVVPSPLAIERALTKKERDRMLDAADHLLAAGGRREDRNRFLGKRAPKRKSYRPYRNRAIIYTLMETGMRRTAALKALLSGFDPDKKRIETFEKGGHRHTYKISTEGVKAINDYLTHERPIDAERWSESGLLFLPAKDRANSKGQLTPKVVNDLWNYTAKIAEIDPSKTPHSARHAMGRHVIDKTGNPQAVQRQLGHKNVRYSLQYTRVTEDELGEVLDER